MTQRHVTGQDHQSTCEHDSVKLSKRQVRLHFVLLEIYFSIGLILIAIFTLIGGIALDL